MGLGWTGLDWIGLNRMASDLIELGGIGLD